MKISKIKNLNIKKPPPYWEDKCPVCDEKAINCCRCIINNRNCKNGHDWHWVNGEVVLGTGH